MHYKILYVSDKSTPGRAVYLQKLVEGNMLKASDSLVILEALSDERTRVTVLNFFIPDAGIFRSFVEGKIWKESMRNGFH